jgi:RNAse (barnase) inhibitor barstar
VTEIDEVLAGQRAPGAFPVPAGTPVSTEPAAAAGWLVAVLDGRAITSAAELFEACAGALEFPEWFGRNFDALADCLGDLSWLPAPGYLLLWRHAEVLAGCAPDEYATAYRVLAAASAGRLARSAAPLVSVLVGAAPP